MLDRETKYTKELAKCRENIKRTKSLIDYHKNMLKAFESKESELMSKLERVKMSSLCDIINKGGYDIDALREAVKIGDFSGILSKDEAELDTHNAEETEDTAVENAAVISTMDERKDDE